MARKETALVDFMDIEGACDNTSYKSIIQTTQKIGVEKAICKWIKYALHNRSMQVNLLGKTREVVTTRGCPQGGVLSPLLWSLVVDDLLVKMSEKGYFLQGYADDLTLAVEGKCPHILRHHAW